MLWIETKIEPTPFSPQIRAALHRNAILKNGELPKQFVHLADALFQCGDYADAAEAYEKAVGLDPGGFRSWCGMAAAYLKLESFEAALTACDCAQDDSADVFYLRGCALRKLGRSVEARIALQTALDRGGGVAALMELLKLLATDTDGHDMLGVCDEVEQKYAAIALVRAYRAIALSRIGRTEEARRIVNLERHIARVRFVPPAPFRSIEQFNRVLSEEILTDPSPERVRRDVLDIRYAPNTRDSPTFVPLYDFMRSEMVRYIDEFPARGLDAVMPQRPDAGTFSTGNVVLRGKGSNGEHIHALGYVSVVYHALVPDCVTQAHDERGALALGCCQSYTGGYAPCWGVRYIKPEAGWLTLFPSHIFHNVVPSGSDSPRVSVVADLKPILDSHLIQSD